MSDDAMIDRMPSTPGQHPGRCVSGRPLKRSGALPRRGSFGRILAAGALFVSATLARGASTTQPTVTYTHDIAPLLYSNCVTCHHAGEVAPFALLSYDDAKKRADQIADVTASRYMPPWKADPSGPQFVGDRHLSDAQIALLGQWAKAGAPFGDMKEMPTPPTFTSDWQLGEPDLIVKVDRPFKVAAGGRDEFRCFVVPLNLTEDKYVTAVEFRPSDRLVVHHALLFLDDKGKAKKLEADTKDGQPGYFRAGGPGFTPTGSLGGWAPGADTVPLPDGIARLVQKGSDLVIQEHLHPTGKEEVEQASVGLYFAKTPPKKLLGGIVLRSRDIDIAPGKTNYGLTDELTLPVNVDIIGLTPHAHLICKDMHAWATLPDGKTQELIHVADWDFNWQGQYQYKNAIHLPKGTVMHMKYVYDNSANNLRNPNDPPKRVTFGEQTTDEMAFLFVQLTTDHPTDRYALLRAMLMHHDGKTED